jgi:electron transport complex protein RnfB
VEIKQIIFAAVSIGALGILFGIGLGIAAKKFEIIKDPMIPKVLDLLPGVNCGGCGYPGCAAFAKAIVEDSVSPTLCSVANAESQENLAALLGLSGEVMDKQVAFVMCKGSNTVAPLKYEYDGIIDCSYANYMQGTGPKLCEYGCLGMGSCVKACQFDAIHVVDGIAVVDEEKCTNCGMCIDVCPKDIIESVPLKSTTRVSCMSQNKGKVQKESCKVGCIGCKLCAKVCPVDCITIEHSLAKIDYDKCIDCGACVEKCPTNAINVFN